jgi:hypothetical protein
MVCLIELKLPRMLLRFIMQLVIVLLLGPVLGVQPSGFVRDLVE